jgi:hypothetical protein
MRLSHPVLIILSGALWLGVGLYLLPLGIHFLITSAVEPSQSLYLIPFLNWLGVKGEQAALFLVVLGLGVGFLKSKTVFAKSVEKGVAHIRSLPPKAPLYSVYTPKYLILLAMMVLLGISLKWFQAPLDMRGFVDVAIGSALINGSMLYFRKANIY